MRQNADMRPDDLQEDLVLVGPVFPGPVTVVCVVSTEPKVVILVREPSSGQTFMYRLNDEQLAAVSAPPTLNPPRPYTPLVVNEHLTISLYHGTNALWLPSIMEFGLGGRNIVEEFNVLELLTDLILLCDQHLRTDEEWALEMSSARLIAGQRVGIWNYRHGSTYLTPSVFTAARYAIDKKFGSEAITYCVKLLQRIETEDASLLDVLRARIGPLLNATSGVTIPIVTEVQTVPIKLLKSETGNDPSKMLHLLERELQREDQSDFAQNTQQMNFELDGCIHAESVKAYTIDRSYRYGSPQVPLVPYPCSQPVGHS
jgi:hypothetical protein